jgi:5-methylcytosine-specific restriction endonuclease McrA
MDLLQCSKCRDWLCPTDFPRANKRKRGRGYTCQRCNALANAALRTAHKAKHANGIDLQALGDQCCIQCEQWKPPQEMSPDPSSATGIRGICKTCRKANENRRRRARRGQVSGSRVCRCCQTDKPLADFRRSHRGRGGHELICKVCTALAQTATDLPLYKGPLLVCTKCDATKPREDFSVDAHNTYTGRQDWCKPCVKRYKDPWRTLHAKELRQKNRLYDAEHKEDKRLRAEKRRLRIQAAPFVEDVPMDAIYLRDKGICQLCFKKCSRKEATRDHVIPVSKGGPHSFQNIVLAHNRCNAAKNNRPLMQQQRLF